MRNVTLNRGAYESVTRWLGRVLVSLVTAAAAAESLHFALLWCPTRS